MGRDFSVSVFLIRKSMGEREVWRSRGEKTLIVLLWMYRGVMKVVSGSNVSTEERSILWEGLSQLKSQIEQKKAWTDGHCRSSRETRRKNREPKKKVFKKKKKELGVVDGSGQEGGKRRRSPARTHKEAAGLGGGCLEKKVRGGIGKKKQGPGIREISEGGGRGIEALRLRRNAKPTKA